MHTSTGRSGSTGSGLWIKIHRSRAATVESTQCSECWRQHSPPTAERLAAPTSPVSRALGGSRGGILRGSTPLTHIGPRYILLASRAGCCEGDQPPGFPPLREILPSLCHYRSPWESRADSGVKRIRQRKPMVGQLSVHPPALPVLHPPTCLRPPTQQHWPSTARRMHPR